MTDNYAELREALTKASPAPWHAGTECPGRCCWHIFQGLPIYDGKDQPVVMSKCGEHDAALMVAARNQLPALLAERDALAADVESLRTERDCLLRACRTDLLWSDPEWVGHEEFSAAVEASARAALGERPFGVSGRNS